jgi:hypothetical protein
MGKEWKKGRGKLGVLAPLLGRWSAAAESPMGPLHCTRVFAAVLGSSYVRLEARWLFGAAPLEAPGECPDGPGKPRRGYEEIAFFGAGAGGGIAFWSFTSDGKRSQGTSADVTDIHPEAVGFEAQMPAGLARMAYWPDGEGGFFFAVESKNKKGWKRFLEHHYRAAGGPEIAEKAWRQRSATVRSLAKS